MKIFNFLIIISIAYLALSCEDNFLETSEMETIENQEENKYPKKYIYSGVTFNPSEFYEYKEDGLNQIYPQSGLLTLFDSILQIEYYDIEEFPFKEIELLSDSLVRLKIESMEEELNLDTMLNYELTENKIKLIGLGDLYRSADPDQIFYCSQTFSYNYFDSFYNRREYAGFDIANCPSLDKTEILNSIVVDVKERGLQFNDTIIFNVSSFNLDLIE